MRELFPQLRLRKTVAVPVKELLAVLDADLSGFSNAPGLFLASKVKFDRPVSDDGTVTDGALHGG